MASLLPFKAVRYARQPAVTFIPGEEPAPRIEPELLVVHDRPSLFIYRQRFEDMTRSGVVGILNRAEAAVFPHEEVSSGNVAACRGEWLESSSVHLWCRDDTGSLAPLLAGHGAPLLERLDRFGCTHTIWEAERGGELQNALHGRELFIADGHHRYAAGWNLATIQVRTGALRTRAAHRLLLEDIDLPAALPIANLHEYWSATPKGHVRFGVLIHGRGLHGLELPHEKGERNVSVLRRLVLGDRAFQTARSIAKAESLVGMGVFRVAFLLEPLFLDKIETDARGGRLLPPKSTDFYPKLAGGLLMAAHQNENVTPAVAHLPGVRNPSS